MSEGRHALAREGSLGRRRDLLEDVFVPARADAELDHRVPVLLVEKVLVHKVDDVVDGRLLRSVRRRQRQGQAPSTREVAQHTAPPVVNGSTIWAASAGT
jgi:hypothetical protein